MSIELYDQAVKDKFKSIYDNTVYAPTDEAFKESYILNSNVLKLPLLSIYQMSFRLNSTIRNDPAFRHVRLSGMAMDDPLTTVKGVLSLPVSIDYQLDVWTKSRKDLNEITAELILWIMRDPGVTITIPNTETPQTFYLKLEDDVTDNSDIVSFGDSGRFYRGSMNLTLEAARIFSTRDVKVVLESLVDIVDYDDEDIKF